MNWLIELVNEFHTSELQTRIFGLILYSDESPYVKKMLEDTDFWKALDEKSGKKWYIFAIKSKQGHFEIPKTKSDQFAFMIPIWKEPEENKELLEDFEVDSTKNLPLFITFFIGKDNELTKYQLPIEGKNVDSIYESTANIIDEITEAIDKIELDNYENTEGLTNALDALFENRIKWNKIKNGYKILKKIKELLSITE